MADERFISIEINEADAIRWLNRQAERQAHYARELLDDIASFSVHDLRIHVPEFSSYTLRHVDREIVRWVPGGAGGGGEWSTVVGVKSGTSQHPLYAEFGTGIYATPSRGFIEPNVKPLMSFYSFLYGRRIRIKRAMGQKAQHYFYRSWLATDAYARYRLMGKIL